MAEIVASYSPAHISPSVWGQVSESVRRAVLAGAPTSAMAQVLLPTVAGFAGWIVAEGYAVSVDVLRDLELIERYVSTGMRDNPDSSRATRRAALRRVARRLDPDPRPEFERIRYRQVKPPYSSLEIRQFYEAACAQPTAARRDSLLALLALGLGCGLDASDLAWVRRCDVRTQNAAVLVSVAGGLRPRTVCCLDAFADQLLALAEPSTTSLLIGGNQFGRRNVATPVLERLANDRSLPRLAPARLRSTWLVHHLNQATPLSVLMPAAGLRTARSLDDLLPYGDPVSDERSAMFLRGTR